MEHHLFIAALTTRHVDVHLVVQARSLVQHGCNHSVIGLAQRREHRRRATLVGAHRADHPNLDDACGADMVSDVDEGRDVVPQNVRPDFQVDARRPEPVMRQALRVVVRLHQARGAFVAGSSSAGQEASNWNLASGSALPPQ